MIEAGADLPSIEKGLALRAMLLPRYGPVICGCQAKASAAYIGRQRKVDGCVVMASVEDVNGIHHLEKRFTCQLVQEKNYTCSKSVC